LKNFEEEKNFFDEHKALIIRDDEAYLRPDPPSWRDLRRKFEVKLMMIVAKMVSWR